MHGPDGGTAATHSLQLVLWGSKIFDVDWQLSACQPSTLLSSHPSPDLLMEKACWIPTLEWMCSEGTLWGCNLLPGSDPQVCLSQSHLQRVRLGQQQQTHTGLAQKWKAEGEISSQLNYLLPTERSAPLMTWKLSSTEGFQCLVMFIQTPQWAVMQGALWPHQLSNDSGISDRD